MMRRLASALALGFSLTAPVAAQEMRPVHEGWALDPDGVVKIHNYVGSVRVIGWSRDSVDVSGRIATHLRTFGGGTRRGVKLGADGGQRSPRDVAELVVRVPMGADVAVRGASTDILITGLVGIVDAATVGGRLVVEGSPRALTVETMDGALRVQGNPLTLRARSASGPLEFDGAAQDASLRSVSGRVAVTGGPMLLLRAETISGDIHFDAQLARNADVALESHSGRVDANGRKAAAGAKLSARSFRGTTRSSPP